MQQKKNFKSVVTTGKANATVDIDKINQCSKKPLKPEDVYVCSVVICDNDVDRDGERFPNATLNEMEPLFLGVTVISDHSWTVENQFARIYNTTVEQKPQTNAIGEPLTVLRADIYMLNNEQTKPIIEKIEAGIMKEVSVGFSIAKRKCSICGEDISGYQCSAGHKKGKSYDGKLCYYELQGATDAYELSFVAVPAQRNAGVSKGATSGMSDEERAKREQILKDSGAWLGGSGTLEDHIRATEAKNGAKEAERIQMVKDSGGWLGGVNGTWEDHVRAYNAKAAAEKVKHDQKMAEIIKETDIMIENDKSKQVTKDTYVKPDATSKAAFYRAAITGKYNDRKHVMETYKTLGAIPPGDPSLGGGDNLMPRNMAQELLSEPVEVNTLRQIEPVTIIRGLEEPVFEYTIDDTALADITDLETANEIELSGDRIVYGRFKTKIKATISDTVLYGTDTALAEKVEAILKSGIAIKEKMTAFRTVSDGEHDHMSFYLNGIKTITGPDLVEAIINAWADLPESFAVNAKCVMRKTDYFKAIKTLANSSASLWGQKPEDVIGVPVIFNDYAVTPIVGDFSFSRQNYDIGAIFDQDKDIYKGEHMFVLTFWGDHRIRLKSAFRLAKVN